jgi:hypothetical protein
MKTTKHTRHIILLTVILFFVLGISFTKAQLQSSLYKESAHHGINIKKYVVPGSAMFLSGLIDGTLESIKFHYCNGFKARFKNANDQFWNPDISWTNKYKNANPSDGEKFRGSTTALVCTTDAYHGLRTAKNLINTFTVVFYLNRSRNESRKTTWKKILTEALVLTTLRNIGFTATYSGLFKCKSTN